MRRMEWGVGSGGGYYEYLTKTYVVEGWGSIVEAPPLADVLVYLILSKREGPPVRRWFSITSLVEVSQ